MVEIKRGRIIAVVPIHEQTVTWPKSKGKVPKLFDLLEANGSYYKVTAVNAKGRKVTFINLP
jgi:hypothetical protein